jgi:hypothetical protein
MRTYEEKEKYLSCLCLSRSSQSRSGIERCVVVRSQLLTPADDLERVAFIWTKGTEILSGGHC